MKTKKKSKYRVVKCARPNIRKGVIHDLVESNQTLGAECDRLNDALAAMTLRFDAAQAEIEAIKVTCSELRHKEVRSTMQSFTNRIEETAGVVLDALLDRIRADAEHEILERQREERY